MPSAPKFEAPQGQPLHEVEFRAITESLAGNGVLNNGDLQVTDGTNALEIDIAAGTVYYVATEYSLGATATKTLSGGDATYDRWDTIAFDTATTSVVVHEGNPEQYPTAPDIGGGEMLLATVYVPSGATDIGSSNIRNWRAKFSNESEEVHYDDGTGVYGVDNVDAALDELQEAAQISAYPLAPGTDLNVNGYPFQNSDLANSTVTVNAGTGVSTTNASIGLGGSATISVDSGDVDLEFVRSADNSITAQLASLPTNPGAFGLLIDAAVDGTPGAGTVQSYGLGLDATELIALEAEADGAGAIQNPRLPLSAPAGLLSQTAAPGYTGEGATFYDSDEDTIKSADDTGSYQRPLSRQDVDHFDKDETGTVANGNLGIVWFTSVPDGSTIEVLQAGLLLEDLQAAPTDVDLVIFTGDNAGAVTKRATVIDGDGTVQDDLTGSPLASWNNSTGSAQTTAIGIDNGQFNAGSGSSQDVATTFIGRVV